MAFGVGPSMGMNMGGGAMGNAAKQVAGKFTNQPAQTQPFGGMGNNFRTTMDAGSMPMQGGYSAQQQQAPGMMQNNIGPSNFQDLLRRYLMSQQQPMGNMSFGGNAGGSYMPMFGQNG